MRRVLLVALLVTLAACTLGPDEPVVAPSASQSSPPPSTTSSEPAASGPSKARLNQLLIDAAWAGDIKRARALVAKGADVNAQDRTQQSAYLIATSEGDLRLLELTLRNGANVRSLDSFNGTGLIRAADRGHAYIVGRLLRTEIKVDHVNYLGWTALHEAILLGDGSQRYVDTVRLLVAGGADVELPAQNDGAEPLDQALAEGHSAIAQTLRWALRGQTESADSAYDRIVSRPNVALLSAVTNGDADRAAVALREGADLDTRDSRGRTPLLLAAAEGQLAVARLLVGMGASPDALDDQHDTPWLVTGVTGSVAMAEVLLTARPDLTIVNRFGGTSLIPASERGHVDYVRRVVKTSINVDHINDLGWTALLEAVILGDGSRPYQQIVRTLLDAGADPSIADQDGITPLEHAVAGGQDDVAAGLRATG